MPRPAEVRWEGAPPPAPATLPLGRPAPFREPDKPNWWGRVDTYRTGEGRPASPRAQAAQSAALLPVPALERWDPHRWPQERERAAPLPLDEPAPQEWRPPPPLAVRAGRAWLAVQEVVDRWRVDDGWWREESISRMYWQVLLEDGRMATLFQELRTGGWWRQSAQIAT